MWRVADVVAELGLDLTGWTLTRATGVSGDGEAIVGYGTNPAGDTEAWLLVIDEREPAPVPGFYRLGTGTAAHAVSGDGATVIGTDAGDATGYVFRWRQTTGLERLLGHPGVAPLLAYPEPGGRLIDVSEDGEEIAVTARSFDEVELGFRWTSGVLLMIDDRTLPHFSSFVGGEVHAVTEGWVAVLPEPVPEPDASLLTYAGAPTLTALRRARRRAWQDAEKPPSRHRLTW